LNGDFDNDAPDSDVQPTSHDPMPDAKEGDPSFRPFRAWASTYESPESPWERFRSRFKSLFTRQRVDERERVASPVEPQSSPAAVGPPQDFRFPWTRGGNDAPGVTPVFTGGPVSDEASFESIDDALPAVEPRPDNGSSGADQRPSTKRRLLSRFFARPQASPAEADIEVHEDQIEAAAHALDAEGEAQFESFEGTSNPPADAFVTVEDALPSTPNLDDLPIVGDFAAADTRPPLTLGELSSSPPPSVDENSTTAEAPLVFIPTLEEVEAPATGFDGGSTQDIELRTDEFAVAALEAPTTPISLIGKRSWTSTFFARLFRRGDTKLEMVGVDPVEAARVSSGFLLAKFRAFYNEIIRLQHQKSEFTSGFSTAILTDLASDASPDVAAETLSKRLCELLELQAAEAKWMGGEAGERYPDAQYAMAALADEIFTNTEWEGKASWPRFSLERKLHRSHGSDLEVFRRVDRLLKETPDTVVARDLARVYLLVLAAGFQGKWRPFGLSRPLAEYRRRLYEYIYGSDALMLYAPERRVCPDAATRTLEGHAVSRFSAMQRWVAVVLFLIVTYTVVAHMAWSRASADLEDVTSRIKTGAASDGAAGEVVQQ
jgi:type IV/VI secretion system ImpK/VasF family protein